MGADGVNGSVKLEIVARHLPPSPYLQAVLARIGIDVQLVTTMGDRVYFAEDVVIAGGATANIDLQVVTDAYGSAVTATEVVFLALLAHEDNQDDIEVQPGAATGWVNWIQAGSVMRLREGNAMIYSALGRSIDVTGASKILSLVNTEPVENSLYTILVITKD